MSVITLTNPVSGAKMVIHVRYFGWATKAVAQDPKVVTTDSLVFLTAVMPPNNVLMVKESVDEIERMVRAAESGGRMLVGDFGKGNS